MKLDVDRVCRALRWIAYVWFGFTAWWGIASMPTAGHLGAGAAVSTMMAEASLRWHTFYPLWDWYRVVDPGPAAAYTHHPFGTHWLSAIFVSVIGHRDIVCNLPAAFMSTAMPPLLYRIGKRAWGEVAGTATVLGFVVVPLTVGYSIFHNVEVMTMFGALLFYFGHLEYQATGRRVHLLVSVLGALISTSGDWPGYLLVGPLLAWSFVRAFALPRWATPAIHRERYAMWWAWSVAVTCATFALWMAFFQHIDRIGEWLAQGKSRGGGSDMPLAQVLESRKNWIDFSFTPLAIWIGKAAAYLALLRFIVRRRDDEMIVLVALFGSAAQYIVFKRGADIHIFWPQYFGIYYALAVGMIVATFEWIGTVIARFVAPTRTGAIAVALAVVASIPTIVMVLPDGARALVIWRRTGGKYDDKGSRWATDAALVYTLKTVVRPRVRPGEVVGHLNSWGWEHDWAVKAQHEDTSDPRATEPFWVARAHDLGADHMKRVVAKNHVRVYGDAIFVVTRGEPNAPIDAYSLHEREPNLLEWMFTNNTTPVRTITNDPDAFSTWEWRVHLDQPATPPTAPPTTLDELRIAHNVAVAAERADEAERLREKIVDQIDRTRETHFDDGSELMGVRVLRSVTPELEIWIQSGGPTASDSTFAVRSNIVKKAPLSTIPIDAVECDHSETPAISTKLWKKGFVYAVRVELHHRLGLESYWMSWPGGPHRTHGTPHIDLVEVP